MKNNKLHLCTIKMMLVVCCLLMLAACTIQITTPTDDTNNNQQTTNDANKSDTQSQTGNIDLDQAKEIAANHAGYDVGEVTFVKEGLDSDSYTPHYEIEFMVDGYKYEYDISYKDGTVMDFDKEIDYTSLEGSDVVAIDQDELIGEDEVKQIVLDDAKVNESDIIRYRCKIDYDDGILKYEVKFYSGAYKYEYDLDAKTGEILKREKEIDD